MVCLVASVSLYLWNAPSFEALTYKVHLWYAGRPTFSGDRIYRSSSYYDRQNQVKPKHTNHRKGKTHSAIKVSINIFLFIAPTYMCIVKAMRVSNVASKRPFSVFSPLLSGRPTPPISCMYAFSMLCMLLMQDVSLCFLSFCIFFVFCTYLYFVHICAFSTV